MKKSYIIYKMNKDLHNVIEKYRYSYILTYISVYSDDISPEINVFNSFDEMNDYFINVIHDNFMNDIDDVITDFPDASYPYTYYCDPQIEKIIKKFDPNEDESEEEFKDKIMKYYSKENLKSLININQFEKNKSIIIHKDDGHYSVAVIYDYIKYGSI
jgi:hypothetical protein